MDWTDDVVYSNIAYPLAALAGGGWHLILVLIAGLNLGLGSATYHATYADWASKWDVWAMLLYLVSLFVVVFAVWTPWAWVALPFAAVYYWWRTPRGDLLLMSAHVGYWTAVTLVGVAVRVGWWAAVPTALFGASVAVRLVFSEDSDAPLHSLWHILSAAAAASVLMLV